MSKTLLAGLFLVTLFTACKDELPFGEFPGLFRPVAFTAELNKTVATISWAPVDGAENYTLQLSQDSLFTTRAIDTTLTGKSFVIELPGETKFFARIRANALDTLKSSQFNQKLSFKTPKENLFLGYTSVMSDYQTMKLNWTPNTNVNKLVLKDGAGAITEYPIDHTELVAGQKIISGLPNSNYTIQLYNNIVVRGSTSVLIEGDVYLTSGMNLGTAIAAATPGQVILLEKGASFTTSSGATPLSKNIKIKGASPTIPSTISMVVGSGTTTSSAMFSFLDQSNFNYVTFENLDITGNCSNTPPPASTRVGYMFNNSTMTTLGKLTFNNCSLRNFGNTPIRLQGGKGQKIDSLIINKCKISDFGYTSTYSLVNINTADYINNIYMSNSTFFNFKGSLILRASTVSGFTATMGTISIINCTMNQGMQDTGARYLIDANGTTITNGVTIKNCIFGSTGGTQTAGVRLQPTTPLNVTGSYYTNDYKDEALVLVGITTPAQVTPVSCSIKGKMTLYPGLSTDLWTDPKMVLSGTIYTGGGNFTLKDATFAGKGVAGDLSWY